MKLYTEEQVRDMLSGAMRGHWMDEFWLKYKSIELPSDEEIGKYVEERILEDSDESLAIIAGFILGAKWVIEQIKQQADGK